MYRFWRDASYGISVLLISLIAGASGTFKAGFSFATVAMGCLGLWVLMYTSTHESDIIAFFTQKSSRWVLSFSPSYGKDHV